MNTACFNGLEFVECEAQYFCTCFSLAISVAKAARSWQGGPSFYQRFWLCWTKRQESSLPRLHPQKQPASKSPAASEQKIKKVFFNRCLGGQAFKTNVLTVQSKQVFDGIWGVSATCFFLHLLHCNTRVASLGFFGQFWLGFFDTTSGVAKIAIQDLQRQALWLWQLWPSRDSERGFWIEAHADMKRRPAMSCYGAARWSYTSWNAQSRDGENPEDTGTFTEGTTQGSLDRWWSSKMHIVLRPDWLRHGSTSLQVSKSFNRFGTDTRFQTIWQWCKLHDRLRWKRWWQQDLEWHCLKSLSRSFWDKRLRRSGDLKQMGDAEAEGQESCQECPDSQGWSKSRPDASNSRQSHGLPRVRSSGS